MKIFISAERAELSKQENQERSHYLLGMLTAKGIPFKRFTGCYQDVQEESFLTYPENDKEIQFLKDMAKKLEQESVLLVDLSDKATLWFTEGNEELELGELIEVSEQVAKNQSNYSMDKQTGKFYVTCSKLH